MLLTSVKTVLLTVSAVFCQTSLIYSPEGPRYCESRAEFKCMNWRKSIQHIFCDCHKYPCSSYEPQNLTKFRAFNMHWHNKFRESVARTKESDGSNVVIGTGQKVPPGSNIKTLSYNYNMEESARWNAKKCVTPLLHDCCHATPQYPVGDGSGQNMARLGTEAQKCMYKHAPVKNCDVNVLDKYEAISYVAMRTWFDEVKDIHNLSVLTKYILPPLPKKIIPNLFKDYSHFISMIWGNSDQMGCALTTTPKNMSERFFYFTCHYHPRGNVLGEPVYDSRKPCPPGFPRKGSKYYSLCGYEELPEEPPPDFFTSFRKSGYTTRMNDKVGSFNDNNNDNDLQKLERTVGLGAHATIARPSLLAFVSLFIILGAT